MKNLLFDNLRCWYELSWQPGERRKPPAIILRVHRDFVKKSPGFNNQTIIRYFQKNFTLGTFEVSLEKNFGFEEAPFKRQKASGEFLEFRIDIPVIERLTKQLCPSCNGRGKDEWDMTCMRCNGSKKETRLSWTAADAITAGLAIFFELARFNGAETSAFKQQLFEVWSNKSEDSHHLWGDYSPAFMKWLHQHPVDTEFPRVEEAMQETYFFMFNQRSNLFTRYFKAQLPHSGYLTLDCPGDACGIHPSTHGNTPERGCEFTCHNLDSAVQQLTLLAGLAALHDKVRKET